MKIEVFKWKVILLILFILIGVTQGLKIKKMNVTKENNVLLQKSSIDTIDKKSAILIALFNNKDFKGYSKIKEIQYKLKNNNWEVDCFIDDDVTIETFKKLSSYDLVLIETHGTNDSNLLSGKKYSMFHKVRHFFNLDDKEECLYCKYKNLIKSDEIIDNDRNLIITPKFIKHYNKNFKNSIVLINSCYSSKNEELSEAFLKNGAACFWGNTEDANIGVASETMNLIVEKLVNEGYSQDEIYEYLQNEVVRDEGLKVGTAVKYKFNNNINELKLIKNKNTIDNTLTEKTDNKKLQETDNSNLNNTINMNDDNLDYNNFKDNYYTSYSGIRYAYPEFLIEDKSISTNNSITFYSPAKSIKLNIYSAYNYEGISATDIYNTYFNTHNNISLNAINNDKFTISGEEGENVYYYSAIVNNDLLEYFEIIYPKKYINEFNSIVQKLYDCLKTNNSKNNNLQEKMIGKWIMEGEERCTLTITNTNFGENPYKIDSIEGDDTVYISSDEYKWCINVVDDNTLHIFWYNPANETYTRGTTYYRIE